MPAIETSASVQQSANRAPGRVSAALSRVRDSLFQLSLRRKDGASGGPLITRRSALRGGAVGAAALVGGDVLLGGCSTGTPNDTSNDRGTNTGPDINTLDVNLSSKDYLTGSATKLTRVTSVANDIPLSHQVAYALGRPATPTEKIVMDIVGPRALTLAAERDGEPQSAPLQADVAGKHRIWRDEGVRSVLQNPDKTLTFLKNLLVGHHENLVAQQKSLKDKGITDTATIEGKLAPIQGEIKAVTDEIIREAAAHMVQ